VYSIEAILWARILALSPMSSSRMWFDLLWTLKTIFCEISECKSSVRLQQFIQKSKMYESQTKNTYVNVQGLETIMKARDNRMKTQKANCKSIFEPQPGETSSLTYTIATSRMSNDNGSSKIWRIKAAISKHVVLQSKQCGPHSKLKRKREKKWRVRVQRNMYNCG